jgi:hypothetical protein
MLKYMTVDMLCGPKYLGFYFYMTLKCMFCFTMSMMCVMIIGNCNKWSNSNFIWCKLSNGKNLVTVGTG